MRATLAKTLATLLVGASLALSTASCGGGKAPEELEKDLKADIAEHTAGGGAPNTEPGPDSEGGEH